MTACQFELKKQSLFMAPMEGVLDPEMRQIFSSYDLCDYFTTEFIRVTSRLNPSHVFYKYAPELHNKSHTQNGHPVFIQILGGDPVCMSENGALAAELGAYGVDINFGCPAPTVNRHDGGSVILKNPDRIFKITEKIRKAVPLGTPVSTKIRLGFEDSSQFLENAQACEQGGASFLAVHGRTKRQGYKPPADWNAIAKIKENLKIPVIANGDIFTESDIVNCKAITKCDHIMLGRGLLMNPYINYKQKKMKSSPKDQTHFNFKMLKDYSELWTQEKDLILCGRLKQWLRYLSKNSEFFKTSFVKIRKETDSSTLLNSISEDLNSLV